MKIESPVLRRLGPVPYWRGTGKCLDELQKIYKKAMEAAADRLLGTHDPNSNWGQSPPKP